MNAGRCVLTALVLSVPCAGRVQAVDNVERELKSLSARVSSFRVVPCARSGEMRLTITQSLTIENLRGVRLDDNPPELGELTEPYDANQTDDFDDGTAPYVAKGIVPFRFRYFNCEFNYGGWHNLKMQEYAATHGFNILYPYTRKTSQRSRLPAGTRWLKWGGFVSWDEWMTKHGIPAGRYDMLADLDVAGELVKGDLLKGDNPALWDYLMIDMEHGVLSPADLHKQIWFPRTGSAADKAAFEKRYYHGYALTYTAAMTAAKRLGYRNLSVYGWEPFPRTWWGLDQLQFDPAAYAPWLLYGREIHDSPATDILNPSLYVFYWSPQNTASTICNLDFNRRLVQTAIKPKPLRPYYWTLLHGGDDKRHWWSSQPVPNEEARAWTLFAFFSGVDGFDLWNWSDVGNHHRPRPFKSLVKGQWQTSDICVNESFTCAPENGSTGLAPTAFQRYDFIHVVSADDATGLVRFQKIDPENPSGQYGLTQDKPVYAMQGKVLVLYLRAESDPVSGVVEGMALAKPFEYILRHASPMEDVSSRKQFLETLPIVRRVQLGKVHLVATYDSKVVYGGPAREIVLKDFAGHQGVTLRLPADSQTRLWVIRDQ